MEAENAQLRVENAELRRKLGMDSTNSSTPPSQDSAAAKGKRRSQRVRSKNRKPGGQPGHAESVLQSAAKPDQTETAAEPAQCGADLASGQDAGMSWTQVWGIPPIQLQRVHYLLPRRRCGCCGKTTTAAVSSGQAGAGCFWPNVHGAAILLSAAGNGPGGAHSDAGGSPPFRSGVDRVRRARPRARRRHPGSDRF
ncbi:DUF6444 domain-containing protein [Saccharopolyspora sp. ASAGF58]|uniref:DUF6444 domain-containing protein n=1 Tax=Saccharopolyspora sp. ASAGF58 TaxID=2719023 RepID=UPI0035301B54